MKRLIDKHELEAYFAWLKMTRSVVEYNTISSSVLSGMVYIVDGSKNVGSSKIDDVCFSRRVIRRIMRGELWPSNSLLP